MEMDSRLLSNIIQSFAVTSGVPAFVMSRVGSVHSPSSGFPVDDYDFADFEELRHTVVTGLRSALLSQGQHHTLYTRHQFVYNLVVVQTKEEGLQVLVAGPLRLHTVTDSVVRSIHSEYRDRSLTITQISQRISQLPIVPMSRVEHLGRVQVSLCNSYSEEGGPLPVRNETIQESAIPTDTVADSVSALDDVPTVSFTLVDEKSHVSYEFLTHVKELVLSGNIEAIRELSKQSSSVPLDRLIQTDTLQSVRYHVITTCATIVGMVFDRNLPYEQVMMTADSYIRKADRTNDVHSLIKLLNEAIEAFARLARRYSSHSYSSAVRDVLHHIDTHLTEKITLEGLAEVAGLSPSHLSRLIKRETGSSLSDLLNTRRVNESKYLLLHTDHSIFHIARLVGFTYQNHFAEQFKARTGMTPSGFRTARGKGD